MNAKSFFENFRLPSPPADLREQMLAAAAIQELKTTTSTRNSFTERCWRNRKLHFAWLLSVISLFAFVQLWNPPFPAAGQNEKKQFIVSLGNDEWSAEWNAISVMVSIPRRNSEKYYPHDLVTLEELE